MTHAEHLRSMAKDHLIAGNEHTADSLLAGADALEVRDRVRHALSEIDRLDYDAWIVWKRDADIYAQGSSDAYTHARDLLTEALEGEA